MLFYKKSNKINQTCILLHGDSFKYNSSRKSHIFILTCEKWIQMACHIIIQRRICNFSSTEQVSNAKCRCIFLELICIPHECIINLVYSPKWGQFIKTWMWCILRSWVCNNRKNIHYCSYNEIDYLCIRVSKKPKKCWKQKIIFKKLLYNIYNFMIRQ